MDLDCDAFAIRIRGRTKARNSVCCSPCGSDASWLSSGIDVSQYTGGLQMVGMNRPLYPVVFPGDIITLTLIVVTFGFFASLYPARRAVALDPIAALNKH